MHLLLLVCSRPILRQVHCVTAEHGRPDNLQGEGESHGASQSCLACDGSIHAAAAVARVLEIQEAVDLQDGEHGVDGQKDVQSLPPSSVDVQELHRTGL